MSRLICCCFPVKKHKNRTKQINSIEHYNRKEGETIKDTKERLIIDTSVKKK